MEMQRAVDAMRVTFFTGVFMAVRVVVGDIRPLWAVPMADGVLSGHAWRLSVKLCSHGVRDSHRGE